MQKLPQCHYYIPKNVNEYTLWFNGKVNPVHQGIYDVVWFNEQTYSGSLEWTGKKWKHIAWHSSKPRPVVDTVEFWRGLRKQSKRKKL